MNAELTLYDRVFLDLCMEDSLWLGGCSGDECHLLRSNEFLYHKLPTYKNMPANWSKRLLIYQRIYLADNRD